MHVEFEFTRDDLIDASRRFFGRGKVANSEMWKTAVYCGIILGVAVFFLFRHTPGRGLTLGLVVAGIMILCYPLLHKKGINDRLRRIAKEIMPGRGPYICEVEIRPEGIWVRQMNRQITYEWLIIDTIDDSGDAVNIFSSDGGGVVVRERAFASKAEQARFVELARAAQMKARSEEARPGEVGV
jgi:hypothetical protein